MAGLMEGKVAVVTGPGGGVGRGLARLKRILSIYAALQDRQGTFRSAMCPARGFTTLLPIGRFPRFDSRRTEWQA